MDIPLWYGKFIDTIRFVRSSIHDGLKVLVRGNDRQAESQIRSVIAVANACAQDS